MPRLIYTRRPPLGAEINSSHPLAQGLALAYPLNEGGGRILQDISGNEKHMLNWGSTAAWDSGAHNKIGDGPSVYADGTANSVYYTAQFDHTTLAVNPLKSAMTLVQYWNQNATLGNGYTCGYVNAPNGTIAANSWGFRQISNEIRGVLNAVLFTAASGFPSGAWSMAAMTYSPAAATAIIFANGVPILTTGSVTAITWGSEPTWIFGINSESQYVVGASGPIYVWNRALEPQEIRQLYVTPYAMYAPPRRRRRYRAPYALMPRPGPGVSPFQLLQFARPVLDTTNLAPWASVTGTAAIAEADDTVAGTGASSTTGTAAISETDDAVAGTGASSTTGSAAIAEADDTAAGVGASSTTGSAAIVETDDTVAGVGAAGNAGVATIVEGTDAAASVGTASTVGAAAILEATDAAAGVGVAGAAGTAALSEASDIASGVGASSTAGAGAILEPDDTAAGVGAAGATFVGAATISEPTDLVVGVATGYVIPASLVELMLEYLAATFSSVPGVSVYRSRAAAVALAEGIVAILQPEEEEVTYVAVTIAKREFTFQITILARSAAVPDQVADPVRVAMHKAMMVDQTFGGLANRVVALDTKWEVEEADQTAAALKCRYKAIYLTPTKSLAKAA